MRTLCHQNIEPYYVSKVETKFENDLYYLLQVLGGVLS